MMEDWISNDAHWAKNRERLVPDFDRMASLKINHAALFLRTTMFFEAGKPVAKGYDRLDEIIRVAKERDIRVTLFTGPFIDNEEEYLRVTGQPWKSGTRWFPSFNQELFDAYVAQARPLAERYANEPAVLGHGDRIDRFHKGFDNVSVPFNLKEEWAAFLRARYGSFANLIEAVGGPEALENRPKDFNEVFLPQESKFNASLRYPLAYDYINWQKKTIGDTQHAWDAAVLKLAPKQIMWTPFEGCTLDWAMLDGFTPETKKLHAIWMEYYHWQAVRTHGVGPFEEWSHTREFVTQRLHHESPTIYNTAYLVTRYVKLSTQRPVVLCHGARLDAPTAGAEDETHQLAMIDRVNAACLDADGDGWHYWCFSDDWESSLAHRAEQKADPTATYWQGESMGLFDYDDHPRKVVPLVYEYSRQLERRVKQNQPVRRQPVLVLSSAARMYSLFRRMAQPTASAVNAALARMGARADFLWTAQNDVRIEQSTLDAYKLIVIADNVYGRDFREMPEKLLRFVEHGGTLYFPLDRFDSFEDEHGVKHASDALRRLSGVDPAGQINWPGYKVGCRNWPFPTSTPNEPNFDALAFPRLHWGIVPEFRHRTPVAQKLQMLGFRTPDHGDAFTIVPALVAGAQTIAVGKFNEGNWPFVWRHRIGKGTVYVNAWTNNVFRDGDVRSDHGSWEYDWLVALPIESSGIDDIDITAGPGMWLRNTWGYFSKQM